MSVLIVGGDNIEMINCNLCKYGYCVAKHITGRKNKHKCIDISKDIDLILVLTDYVSHGVSNHVKKESKRLGIKTIYSKRAWSSVESLLMG
ncbi:DUF2325 domain-containing protein [Clostridium algoriphilum]|uniref:DUF2325 domain-containing protein n=1 Tax=Clostridium algoriphilum TaxID=198347 RepID=UPI001CF4A767|nr:DUF2325 domain-containing protein [Clostridium algoriphilum]MCB2295691.1 DUF2325 domain-containing protein [Clostridium algoriphilum]